MRNTLIVAMAVSLVLIGGAFVTAEANSCSYDINLSPCSWDMSALLPWNWNWSAVSPCNWKPACALHFNSYAKPTESLAVAEVPAPATGNCAWHLPHFCEVCSR